MFGIEHAFPRCGFSFCFAGQNLLGGFDAVIENRLWLAEIALHAAETDVPAVGSLIAGFVCFQVIQPFQRFSHAAAEDKKILVAGIAGEQDFRRFIKKTDAARRVAGHLDALDAAVSQFENIALVHGMSAFRTAEFC